MSVEHLKCALCNHCLKFCLQASFEVKAAEIGKREAELQECIHRIGDMQAELDDRSFSQNSGAGPLKRARSAIAQLQTELRELDVKIGISRQQLLHRRWVAHSNVT